MSPAEWMRFGALVAAAMWLAITIYRPQRTEPARQTSWLSTLAAVLLAGQVVAEVESVGDPYTPIFTLVPPVVLSDYGLATLLAVFTALAVSVGTLRLRNRVHDWVVLSVSFGLLTVLLCGMISLTASTAVAAGNAQGSIVMSPTLTVPRSSADTPNPSLNDPASVARGKLLYQQNCQICHGIAGDGRGPAGANMRIKPASFLNPQHYQAQGMDGAHFWVIQHGDGQPGAMPAWQGKLTDQQTWDVLNYVKKLSVGQP